MRLGLAATTILSATLAVASAVPTLAQSPAASPAAPAASILAGPAITVTATEYHFSGLPTTLPVGSTLTLVNGGSELHELIIARKNDGVTKSFDELLALPSDEALTYVTPVGQLFAMPGTTADGSIVIPQEGDYIAVCFVPQGMTALPAPSATPDPAVMAGTPHFMLGMVQTFSATAAGTAVGPVPSAAPMGSPVASAAP